jgi:hypothetical protein
MSMAQNRTPPAYQEYAASVIANGDYRVMSLAERGLLYSLKLECWVNHRVPKDSSDLAKFLGVNAEELRSALPKVMFAFQIQGRFIVCPELDNYRNHLDEIREKRASGGRKGAAIANERRIQMARDATVNTPRVSQGSATGSLDKLSPDKLSSISVINKEVTNKHKEWIDDYDSTNSNT